MSISVEKIDLNVLNMHTRFPFKYGIASLVALPHLFVRGAGQSRWKNRNWIGCRGIAAKVVHQKSRRAV